MKIIKRNGETVAFDQNKIIDAVLSAFKEVDGDVSDYAYIKAGNIADYILETCKEREKQNHSNDEKNNSSYLTVEEIQDLVENGLMSTKRKDVARAYITYRYKKNIKRNQMMIASKINAIDVQNQNANVDERSFGGRMGEASDALMKQYALDYCVSNLSKKNHINNEIYIHDLGSYAVGMHNCLSIPFDKLLAEGFNTRQVDIRPARSLSTAFQLVAVIFQLQSLQQFGGVSATHLDWTMVPYVRKSFVKHYLNGLFYCEDDGWAGFKIEDMPEGVFKRLQNNYKTKAEKQTVGSKKVDSPHWMEKQSIESEYFKECPRAYRYALDMTKKECEQAVEGLYHNLNSLQSRSGNQLPFTSINYGTCTLPEGRMIIKALLQGSINGVGKLHRTSIFPCGIFQCMKGVNRAPEDPNYDLYRLALKSTATRLYPNYANVDWTGNAGYNKDDPRTYFSTMGKRKLSPFKIF